MNWFVFILCFVALLPTMASADPISAAITTALTNIGVGAVAAGIIGTFVVQATVAIGLSLVARAFQKKPSSVQQNSIQTKFTTTGGVIPQKIIVGRYATAGHMVAPPRTFSSVGNSHNDMLNYVIELCNVDRITLNSVIIDNKNSALGGVDGNFGTRLNKLLAFNKIAQSFIYNGFIEFYDGTQMTADSLLVDKFGGKPSRPWTSTRIGNGIAYARVSFVANPDLFKSFPEVRFDINGIPLYDPRLDTTAGGSGSQRFSDRSTWVYSDNPIVIVYNIMRGITMSDGHIYGGLIDAEDLPFDNWTAAMNACDVLIGSRKTYRAGFEINVVENEPAEVIEELLKACFGQIAEFGGTFRVQVGAPAASVLSITDDDIIITDPQELNPFPGLENTFNGVNGNFVDPNSLWEAAELDPIFNPTWEEEDGDRRLPLSMGFPTVFVKTQAVHLMNGYVNDARRFRVHTLVLPPDAAILEPLDTISWTSTRNGYTSKLFEVVSLEDRPFSANQFITVRERDSSDYSWSSGDDVADNVEDADDDELDTQAAVGLSAVASEKVIKQNVVNVVTLTVTANNPEYTERVEVAYKLNADSDYITFATGPLGKFEIIDLEDEIYDFRARGFAYDGTRGPDAFVLDVSASGAVAAPSDVTNFDGAVIDGMLHIEWDPVSDADLSHYLIRHSLEAANASWANATTVAERIARPTSNWNVPARAGTFHIRAYDKTGLASENAASFVITDNEVRDFATTLTQTEDPTFSGTKTGCSVTSSELRITSPGTAPTEATYDFSAVIDLGAVRNFRARIDCDVDRLDTSSGLWDNIPGNWDDFPGNWDDWTGSAQFADTNVEFYISITQDDPSGSPTWDAYKKFRVRDFKGRAARFRVIMKSTSDDITPSIKGLQAVVEYD